MTLQTLFGAPAVKVFESPCQHAEHCSNRAGPATELVGAGFVFRLWSNGVLETKRYSVKLCGEDVVTTIESPAKPWTRCARSARSTLLAGGPPDFDGDGTVGILDLLTLLANSGPCA